MSKIFYLLSILLIFSGCSFNQNSKFWTKTEKIKKEKFSSEKLFFEEEEIDKELNKSIKINFNKKPIKNSFLNNHKNNYGRINFVSDLTKISKYKFSKIDNFYRYEPTISFHRSNVIFFDNRGSILKFNNQSKLIWKKNWGDDINYFSNAGFDSALIAINFLNQENTATNFFKNLKSSVNGFIFNKNGYVKKPISIMQIEKLGKLKNIEKCKN